MTVIPFPASRVKRDNLANDNAGDDTPPTPHAPVLRVLAGGLADDEKAFERAYHAAMIAKAERDLIEAQWLEERALSGVNYSSPLWKQRGVAFDKMLNAVILVALTPATTKAQIRLKKRAIGTIWLKAEGDLYDQFRERIALDEEYVAKRLAV